MEKQSSRLVVIASLNIIIPITLLFIYSNISRNFKIFKYDIGKSNELRMPLSLRKKDANSLFGINSYHGPARAVDTSKKRILLFGDSEIEEFEKYFYRYCEKNGDSLVYTIIGYNSTEESFAATDTVDNVIAHFKPDYIVFVMGLNEMFVNDFDKRAEAINKVIKKFNGIPYVWIGPANFAKDMGITDIFMENIDDGCFFLSKDLVLERGKDGRHPSAAGTVVWIDTVAKWLTNSCKYPIKMYKPDSSNFIDSDRTIVKKLFFN